MEIDRNKMLVSMLLTGYNQEQYIKEAIEGALMQTYSPLEIILSDGGSRDKTFDIMKNMAAKYKGPHKIVLNRDATNLGIVGGFNRCIELSSGQWLVKADGDDVSMPDRVEKIVDKIKEDPEHTHFIYSGHIKISNDGAPFETSVQEQYESVDFERDFVRANGYILGCTSSWSRECENCFGRLSEGLQHGQDHNIPFRAMLLGKIAFVPLLLVKYRVFAGSTVAALEKPLTWRALLQLQTLQRNVAGASRRLKIDSQIIQQKIKDLEQVDAPAKHAEMLKQTLRKLRSQATCLNDPSLFKSFSTCVNAAGCRGEAFKLFVKSRILMFLTKFQK